MSPADPGGVGFLVVGSPRSGTTLVQRLACEIPGVRMPAETHFFTRFAPRLLAEHRFPVRGSELAGTVAAYAAAVGADAPAVDVGAVLADLDGVCRRPLDLFAALVRQLAGPAEIRGEKTPGHLVWWKPISRAAPEMRFVAVVRDPRAVVASNLTMPWRNDPTLPAWGDHMHLAFAELWSFFQHQVLSMGRHLGPDRCLVLRYEEVAADPDTTRRRLAAFLGLPPVDVPQEVPPEIVLPSESWKTRALGPVEGDRVDTWRATLDDRRAAEIALVCRRAMKSFAYDAAPTTMQAAGQWLRLGPAPALRLARYARSRRVNLRTIEGAEL